MNTYDRMMYCLARAEGERMFTQNKKEAQTWFDRYLEEKAKYEQELLLNGSVSL